MAGNDSFQFNIAGVTQADPCIVTTDADHGYQDKQIVRFTDLDHQAISPKGMRQLDGNKYKITVISTTTFSLQDILSGEDINSTAFDAWISGGKVNLETRALRLNNPQTYPYSDENPYVSNPFFYKP